MAKVLPQVTKLGETALDLFFPQRCTGCGKEGSYICASCYRTLSFIMPPVCPLCGRPQSGGLLCPDCIRWQAAIDGIRSPFRFEGVMQQAIYSLKYRNLRAIAPLLASLLHEYLSRTPLPGDVLVPVPLHKTRLNERGYNQSSLVADALGKLTGIPLIGNCLVKTRKSSPQARTAGVEERRANVAEAFTCRNDRLAGKQVVLVDDVATSGATLDSCAGVLKEAGAKSVWGLTLAREI